MTQQIQVYKNIGQFAQIIQGYTLYMSATTWSSVIPLVPSQTIYLWDLHLTSHSRGESFDFSILVAWKHAEKRVKVNLWCKSCQSELMDPKNPDPLKNGWFEDLYTYRFKPFHWRVQGFLGEVEFWGNELCKS